MPKEPIRKDEGRSDADERTRDNSTEPDSDERNVEYAETTTGRQEGQDFDEIVEELIEGSSDLELRQILDILQNAQLAQRGINLYITRNQAEQGIIVGDYAVIDSLSGSFSSVSSRHRLEQSLRNAQFEVVSRRELEKLSRVFVPPRPYADARQILLEKHFLVIQGNAGCGKRATAIHLATEFVDIDSIFELPPSYRFSNLAFLKNMDTGSSCYIIDSLTTDSLEDFEDYHLSQLLEHLTENDCYLIATVHSLGQSQKIEMSDFRISFPPKDEEEIATILKAHLDYYSDDEVRQTALALVDDKSVRSTLAHLQTTAQIDLFASRLVKVARKESVLSEAIEDFTLVTDQRMDEWFLKTCSTPFERAFLIALAAFNGARTQHIWQAARLLVELAPTLKSEGENSTSGIVTTILDEAKLYERCCCQTGVSVIQTEYGKLEVETLEFASSRYQLDVLSYIWRRFPSLRRSVSDWLYLIGLYGTIDITALERAVRALQGGDRETVIREIERLSGGQDLQVLAAGAVGELARYDFRTIQIEVLNAWVRTGELISHTLVGIALLVPLWDDRLRDTVLKLLHYWSTLNNPKFNCAAAIACGYTGTRYPSEALKLLRTILDRDAEHVARIVIQSVKLVFSSGYRNETIFARVIQHLDEWSQDKDKRVRLTASLAFLEIASYQILVNDTKMPVIISVAGQSEASRLLVAIQLHRAFQRKPVRGYATDVLKNWCVLADSNREVAATVDRIIRDMWKAGTQRDRVRLCHLFTRWAEGRPPVEIVKRYVATCRKVDGSGGPR